jgi:hypothetical protein
VLIHIRSTVVGRARPILRQVVNGRAHYSINPALLRRSHRRGTPPPPQPQVGATPKRGHGPDAYAGATVVQDLPPSGRRIAGLRLRNVNAFLGALAGLDRWAVEEQLGEFDDLARACKRRGIPLFVLGPTPATHSYWNNRVVRKANAAIRRRLSGGDVPFALIERPTDPAGHPIIRADGVHLTVEGHRFVAEQLCASDMGGWAARILASRR